MSDSREAILKIGEAEMKFAKAREKVLELCRAVPKDPITDYTFGTQYGDVPLSGLFGSKSDLIVIHNMGIDCRYCTLWADGFSGVSVHLSDRAGFVVASPDTVEVQQNFAMSREWDFPMVSCAENTFIEDMGFQNENGGALPGVSTFSKADDGIITRQGAANFGPGDDFCGTWHILDMLKDGADGWVPKYGY
jgi:predicted dithiol-disulfide oxidoreductase (DUF899 family)